MTTFASWTRVGKSTSGRTHRCYEVVGPDATIRDDCVAEILARVQPGAVVRLRGGEVSSGEFWDVLGTVPFGVESVLVVLSSPERVDLSPLQPWLANRTQHVGITLVLVSDQAARGKRVRDRRTGKWGVELAPWQQWISDTSTAIAVECPTPSVEVVGSTRANTGPSAVASWLSRRVPVTQRQAEYLWRRVGGATALARDVLEQFRLLGIADATALGYQDFVSKVDVLVTAQGAESIAEDLLFDRRSSVLATLASRDLGRTEWSKIVGLLSQRLEWLGPLHHALTTRESLSAVSSNIGIHEKWILHYAHRDDPAHNIARHYSPSRVSRCRLLLAGLDSALASSPGVPAGFGEVLVSAW